MNDIKDIYDLRREVYKKLGKRIEKNYSNFQLEMRIEDELQRIDAFGNITNILLLEQMAEYSRANDVLFLITGDLMASYVCYILGISPLNPIEYKLEFMQCEFWQQTIGLEKEYFRVITDPRGRELLTEAFSKHKHPIIFDVPEICTGNSLVEGMVPLGNISTLPCGTVFKLLKRNKNLNHVKVYKTFNSGNLSGIYNVDTMDIAKFFASVGISNFTDLVFALTSCKKNGFVPPDKYDKDYVLNVKHITPYLKSYLEDTRGHLLFRDQWVNIYSYIMGVSLRELDVDDDRFSLKMADMVLCVYGVRINRHNRQRQKDPDSKSLQQYRNRVKQNILEELSAFNQPIISKEVSSILVNSMDDAYDLKGDFYAEALLTYLTAYNKTYYPEEYKKLHDGVLEIH